MKKKLLALVLCVAMVLTMFTGCGNSNTKNTGGDKTKTEDNDKKDDAKKDDAKTDDTKESTDPKATPVPKTTVDGDADAKDAFVIYGWNTDAKDSVLKVFQEKYPEDAKRLVFVNTGGSNCYQEKLDPLLDDPDNKYYPDMFCMEMDYAMKYTNSDYTLSMDDIGLSKDVYKNMYQYTVDAATIDGKVKGVSWQCCPGGLIYRRSMAKKYLGVSEPDDVQKFFADWATEEKTAQTIQDKSKGKVRLYCGYTELQRPYQALRKDAWLDKDSNLKIDKTMLDYAELAKKYVDKKYASAGSADQQFTDNWNAEMDKDDVFAYTTATWFLQYTLMPKIDKTVGDWGLIPGPQGFYWGGTWLGVGAKCSDTKLAAKILSVLGDKECMTKIYKYHNDFPNNKESVKEIGDKSLKSDAGIDKVLGGQNFVKFFAPSAEKITLPKMCGEDFYINNLFNDQIAQYATGAKSKDDMIADFKAKVKDQYDYVNVD